MGLHAIATESDKKGVHGYLNFYELLLGDRDVQRVLEVGVQTGVSLELWAERWPKAEIVGVDVTMGALKIDGDRWTLHEMDAYHPNVLESLPGVYDFIVDDGSHRQGDMEFFVGTYWKLLSAGGVMVVEDVPNVTYFGGLTAALPTHLRPWSYGVDLRATAPHVRFNDDLLFVVDTRLVGQ